MSSSTIFITRNHQGLTVDVRSKPTIVELQAFLQELMTHDSLEVKAILPASLSAEFMLIQALAFLRKQGKSVYLTWSDHPPVGTAQQIIQSIIQ